MSVVRLLLVAVLLVVLAAAFAASEASLGRIGPNRVAELASTGRWGSAALQRIWTDPARYVNVLTFLRVASEMGAAVCVTVAGTSAFEQVWQVLLAVGLGMGAVSFVLVGVSPRTVGRQHAEPVALAVAPVLEWLGRLLGPLSRALIALGNAVTPGRGFREGPFATEAELRELVDLAQEREVIDPGEREMIHSVFELGDTLARSVMVPRTDMVVVERGTSLHDALSLFLRSGFSRVPIVGAGVDDVLGMLYLKDVARHVHEDPGCEGEAVETQMRPVVFVPESKPVDALLREMQRDSTHVAVVVDEYGGTAGLVTIEDVLEEIVGEIADEYDPEAPVVEHLPNGVFRVSSRMALDELGELFGLDLEDEDVDSVGGLLAKALGRVPIPGARAEVSGLELTAERREGRRNRIVTVLVRRSPADSAGLPDREHADA